MEYMKPADIERESMAIIDRELLKRGITLQSEHAAIIKRVIHATADFDYAKQLRLTKIADFLRAESMCGGVIVTDTNMARAGISKSALQQLGGEVYCYMADETVAAEAKARSVTRAVISMEKALSEHPRAIFAIGNAPTALLRIAESIELGARPALVIGVPVGFVNVVESKERALAACERHGVPAILAMGRKGGSNVAAAICNALLYMASGQLDPGKRG